MTGDESGLNVNNFFQFDEFFNHLHEANTAVIFLLPTYLCASSFAFVPSVLLARLLLFQNFQACLFVS